jgi:16S rRNA (cytosine1402-N4)-methyltransferase
MTKKINQESHEPVLLTEVLESLRLKELARLNKKAKIIDATLGHGGHSKEIIRYGMSLLGIEADSDVLSVAEQAIKEACPPHLLKKVGSFRLVHGNFRNIEKIAKANGFYPVDGILFDLGVSTPQLTSDSRGFSFQNKDAWLDMRIDKASQKIKASDLANSLPRSQLIRLFGKVLNARDTKILVANILKVREKKKIEKVGDFLSIINRSVFVKKNIDVATLPFLALRIAVNSEIENLEEALPQAIDLLKEGGRLAVISFHSGEDRVVKNVFRKFGQRGIVRNLEKKPVTPTKSEIAENPKSRSAKMRVIEKQ